MRRGTIPPDMQAAIVTHSQEVARRLLVSRIALKLTQAALCRLTGISSQNWNNAQRGSRLGVDNAIKLCDETGLTLDWIYRGIRKGLDQELIDAIAKFDRMSPEEIKAHEPKRTRKKSAPNKLKK